MSFFELNSYLNIDSDWNPNELHSQYINPQFIKVLKTIGFYKVYTKGEGAYIYDSDGNRYLDFLSGFGVFNVGRSHPVIRDALKQALDSSLPNLVQMDSTCYGGLLAKELINRSPDNIKKVFFCNSGTESVESALKFVRQYSKKPRILYCSKAFHGLTTGSLALNGDNIFRDGFGQLLPDMNKIPFNDLSAAKEELSKGDVAAVFIEPIQGKGVNIPDPNYFPELRRLCTQHGTLLVMDEVQTGFGRTGKFFAFEHWDIKPDIVTVSKALSGGYIPVGAVLMTDDIYKKTFQSMQRSIVHSNTFGMNDLAMIAGLTTLRVIQDEGLVDNSYRMGELLIEKSKPLLQKYELLKDIRGKGLMIAIELGKPSSVGLKLAWNSLETLQHALTAQMVVMTLFQDHKILTQVAGHDVNVIKLLPPLILTEEEVDYFVQSFEKVLIECHQFPSRLWKNTLSMMKNIIQ